MAIKIPVNDDPPSPVKLKRDVDYRPRGQSESDDDLTWSQLEATGKVYSKGSNNKGAVAQGAAYTGYLLQARPDLVSVVGIYVKPSNSKFVVYFTNAGGVWHTEPLDWDSYKDNLLRAWIRRLYNPETRSNIQRIGIYPIRPTFTIFTETYGKVTDCVILRVGSPFNRRSTIFTNADLVIKSQYLQKGRRFREDTTLQRVHEPHEFPGVVRLAPVLVKQRPTTIGEDSESSSNHGSISNVAEEGAMGEMCDEPNDVDIHDENIDTDVKGDHSGAQEKDTEPGVDVTMPSAALPTAWLNNRRDKETLETLLVLQDKAGPLVDAETPLEALIAFYDLLEGNFIFCLLRGRSFRG